MNRMTNEQLAKRVELLPPEEREYFVWTELCRARDSEKVLLEAQRAAYLHLMVRPENRLPGNDAVVMEILKVAAANTEGCCFCNYAKGTRLFHERSCPEFEK